MASITLTIPDAVLPRVLDAMAATRNYNPATDGTKAQFAKAQLVAWLKSVVVDYEGNAAANTAATSARNTATTDIAIT